MAGSEKFHRDRVRALHRDNFDIAWWIATEDPGLIPDQLFTLACALKLAQTEDPTAVWVARLNADLATRDRWPIVFD